MKCVNIWRDHKNLSKITFFLVKMCSARVFFLEIFLLKHTKTCKICAAEVQMTWNWIQCSHYIIKIWKYISSYSLHPISCPCEVNMDGKIPQGGLNANNLIVVIPWKNIFNQFWSKYFRQHQKHYKTTEKQRKFQKIILVRNTLARAAFIEIKLKLIFFWKNTEKIGLNDCKNCCWWKCNSTLTWSAKLLYHFGLVLVPLILSFLRLVGLFICFS